MNESHQLTLKRAEPLLKKTHNPDTMTPENTVAKFADVLDKFKPIGGQPSDTDLRRIQEVLAPLLLQITYNKMGGHTQPHRPHFTGGSVYNALWRGVRQTNMRWILRREY